MAVIGRSIDELEVGMIDDAAERELADVAGAPLDHAIRHAGSFLGAHSPLGIFIGQFEATVPPSISKTLPVIQLPAGEAR
jgi:hypothetical protein